MELIAGALRRAEFQLIGLLRRSSELFLFPKPGNGNGLEPCLAGLPSPATTELEKVGEPIDNNEDKKSEGFVWGVPKKRKSVEKRMCINIGALNWYYKMYTPKYNLRICDTCGHHYEAKHLCRNCYEKIKTESELIRSQIEAQVGGGYEDKSVVVLYKGESEGTSRLGGSSSQSESNKYLVEVPKERPKFFSKNLLQRTTLGVDKESTTITTTQEKPQISST